MSDKPSEISCKIVSISPLAGILNLQPQFIGFASRPLAESRPKPMWITKIENELEKREENNNNSFPAYFPPPHRRRQPISATEKMPKAP